LFNKHLCGKKLNGGREGKEKRIELGRLRVSFKEQNVVLSYPATKTRFL